MRNLFHVVLTGPADMRVVATQVLAADAYPPSRSAWWSLPCRRADGRDHAHHRPEAHRELGASGRDRQPRRRRRHRRPPKSSAHAAPDGYTFLVGTAGGMTINPALHAKLSYDPFLDFAPVAMLVNNPQILVVHPAVPGENAEGTCRARQIQTGAVQLRFGRHRHRHPSSGWSFSSSRGHRCRARSL